MLDKTKAPVKEPEAQSSSGAPAFVVRVASQVGPNRTIEITYGCPMDMQPKDLNGYMDKVISVVDRQNDKGLLEAAKNGLDRAQKDLQTAIEQRENLWAQFAVEHTVRQRRGEFKPEGGQQKQIDNFDKSKLHLTQVVIPKFKEQIAELEARIAAGV